MTHVYTGFLVSPNTGACPGWPGEGSKIYFYPHAHPVAVGLEVPELPGGEAAQVDGHDHVGKVAVAVPYLHILYVEGFGFPLGKLFHERCELLPISRFPLTSRPIKKKSGEAL